MTSLAVLQPLKRTLTDIMDDEIYHVPTSPSNQFATQIAFNNPSLATTNNNATFGTQALPDMMNSDSTMLLGSSALYNHYNTSTGVLSDGTSSSTAFSIPLKISSNSSPELSATQQPPSYSIPGMFLEGDLFGNSTVYDNGSFAGTPNNMNPQEINPFNAHSDPELQVSYRLNSNNTSMQNSLPPRNRITTLGLDNQTKKDEYNEYLLLIDPDVSPSSFVQQQPSTVNIYDEVQNGIDQFDVFHQLEEIEEEQISDDDEDEADDNDYFQEMDEACGDFLMNSQTQFAPQQYFGVTFEGEVSAPQQYALESQIKPDMLNAVESFDLDAISQSSNMNLESNVPDLVSDEDDEMMFEEEESTVAPSVTPATTMAPEDLGFHEDHGTVIKRRAKAAHHSAAAEISANNPDHLCHLVNPSTGLPCNRQFSRPYDLIRHQDTIHAAKKKIFRCVICEGRRFGGEGNGNSKTFSRNDALSRHIKMKHGIVGDEALTLINEAKANVEYI
ncbi:uncharacterized protein KQ657_001200 [Scheffersomyces spartinae]|uniref:C2H2-type domain-containing protein n=1 Tax=Scheffersomyces spartinae TaxID=45513 RepID=A0A9P7V8F4_9ASCO|nr:uncharacterized protein KQ657_001200 [Scheffersomyces spartinae]KAG7193083.1 hypothetical protein KQ657_001200 [Scheffersomyces spartinae]